MIDFRSIVLAAFLCSATAATAADPAMTRLTGFRTRIAKELGADRSDSLLAWRDSAARSEAELRINGFTGAEIYILHLAAGDRKFLLESDSLRKYGSSGYAEKVIVERDPLSLNVHGDFLRREAGLRKGLLADSTLAPEDREFLALFVSNLALVIRRHENGRDEGDRAAQDRVNGDATAFLAAFPISRHANYVRGDIRDEWRTTGRSIGGSMGAGMAFHHGDLGRTLGNSPAFIFGLNFCGRRYVAEVTVETEITDTRKALVMEGETWRKDLRTQLDRYFIGAGPVLYQGNHLRLAALGQAGMATFYVPEEIRGKNDLEVEPPLGFPAIGLSGWLDWRFRDAKEFAPLGDFGLRLRYQYVWPNLESVHSALAGGYQNVTLELTLAYRGWERVR